MTGCREHVPEPTAVGGKRELVLDKSGTPTSELSRGSGQPNPGTAPGQGIIASQGGRTIGLAQMQLLRLGEYWPIILLALVSLVLHLSIVSFANQLMYDEHYWVSEARSIIERLPLSLGTNPQLGKLFIASGIFTLGDNPWGWRIPSVLFGVASVILFYLIVRKLSGKRTAFLASLLITFETLFFLLSGLGMLDVFMLAFMLLSFLLFLQGRYALSGVSLALSGLCKVTGLFGGMAILGYWLVTRKNWNARNVACFAVSAVVAFFLVMVVTDFIATGEWVNPLRTLWEMYTQNASAKVSTFSPEQLESGHITRPWQWILLPLNEHIIPESLHHIIVITPTILFLIVPSVGYMLYEYFKNGRNIALFGLFWFGATYLPWIVIQLATGRATYLYYFLPTVFAVCMAIGFAVQRAWRKSAKAKKWRSRLLVRGLVVSYLLLHILLFLLLSPLVGPLLTDGL